jgi:CBS domain containing-hemolysin-like protein
MSPAILITATVVGITVSAAAACAVQILHEFWRHELEEYCRRRGKLEWFTRIIERRAQLALGAQTLQMISIGLGTSCGVLYLDSIPPVGESLTVARIGMVAIVSLVLLAANCWIPWAMLNIAAAPYLYRTWRIWWMAALLLAPLTAGVQIVSSLFQRLSGHVPIPETSEETFEDEFMSMVSEGEYEGLLESDARDMIEGVFELDDSIVGTVMTPRSKVDVLEINSTWEELTRQVAAFGHTRLPVVDGQFNRTSDVIGILFVKDLLNEYIAPDQSRKSLRELVRSPMIVPQSKPLDEMLEQFQAERSHMAIVVDEYQAIAGVITIEDILEEIVGEIVDEKDKEEPGEIQRLDDHTIEVDGVVRLALLNDELGLDLPLDQDFDTLSGLIMSTLGSIPRRGHTLRIGDMQIRIQQASRRSIERVQLTLLDADQRPQNSSETVR